MKKIMIFGLPGSGKSTWSIQLSELLHIPVYHLDRFFFVEDWKKQEYDEFLRIQEEIVSKENWIVDGNCMRSLEMRFCTADAAFHFQFSRWVCLWRIFKRLFHRDSRIADRAEGCSERVSWELIVYLWKYERKYKAMIDELHQKYPQVEFHVFHDDNEIRNFTKEILSSDR